MIQINNLKKSFGMLDVLKGIQLDIPGGQATGLVGPNGSGKTTLIKSILGLVKPDRGEIVVNGTRLNGNFNYREQIGYMPQQPRYPENMTVRELLEFIKKVRKSPAIAETELIKQFNLPAELDKRLRTLSGGNKQKAGAVLAMMFDSPMLFLDEPTAGLDPQASFKFKERVKSEKKNGKTVIITSHIMSELEQLVDHVVFILDGKIRYYGTIDNLLKENKEDRLEGAIARMMDVAEPA